MSNFYYQSDYAGIDFEGGSFYYGYEKTYCIKCKKVDCENEKHEENRFHEWCFVAKIGNVETVIPYSEIPGCNGVMFSVGECLMRGIGLFLSNCTVAKNETI